VVKIGISRFKLPGCESVDSFNPFGLLDFMSWMEVSLDIRQPGDPMELIETPHGDLILDERYAGKLYLHGILLRGNRPGGKVYQASYNLPKSRTTRDRELLMDEDEEAQMMMHIWKHAIGKVRDRVLQRYINLLQDYEFCADVNGAGRLITPNTASSIWRQLKSQGRGKFYYGREASDSEVDIIINDLNQTPAPLSTTLWAVLRKFGLVRTPREKRME
jgi:hypothetical protein